MDRKNKAISLALVASSVVGVGFSNIPTLFAAYTEEQVDDYLVGQRIDATMEKIEEIVEEAGSSEKYNDMLDLVDNEGNILPLTDTQENAVKTVLVRLGFTYDRDSDGKYYIEKEDGSKRYNEEEIKEILRIIKTYRQSGIGGNGGFVSGESGFVSGESGASVGSGDITVLQVSNEYELTQIGEKEKIDLQSMTEKIVDSSVPSVATLKTNNAKWYFESTSIDKETVKGFGFDPTVEVIAVNKRTTNIPEDLKNSLKDVKENVAITFHESEEKSFPCIAKVLVDIGEEYAGRKMDAYYILDGEIYPVGDVVVGSDGRVNCSFKNIGYFVLAEK